MFHRLFACRLHDATRLLAVAVLGGFLVPGCSEELGPEHFPTTRIVGRVVEGGKPVGGGWIEFIPTDGAVGNQRSARLGKDGSFAADRVPIGENVIRLVNAPISIPGGAVLFGKFSSPIRRKIAARTGDPMTIDLMEEAMRFQATRPRAVARSSGSSASGVQP